MDGEASNNVLNSVPSRTIKSVCPSAVTVA